LKPKILVNTPSNLPDGKKRVYCPLCLYNAEEIPMVFQEKDRIWICNVCKYVLPPHLDPIENAVITAGNSSEFAKPYTKAVSFKRSKTKIAPDTFTNPMEAWKSDEM
jgi:hypothetical protein